MQYILDTDSTNVLCIIVYQPGFMHKVINLLYSII
jgi:hypothetical protein